MKSIKSAFMVVLLSLLAITGRGQDVTYSPYDKFDYHNGEYQVLGITGDFLYNYRSTTNGAMLEAFDDSMNKAASIILDFFPNKIYKARFISYKDKIIALYQALESNKVVQYAALLDEKARLKNKPVELGSTKTGIFGAMKNYYYSAVSEDKKTILIYSLNDKTGGIEFDGKWLDDSLHIIKRGHATFSDDKMATSGEVTIANDGTVYVTAYTTVGMHNNADRFWLLGIAPGENKFTPHPMPLDDKFASNGYTKIDNVNSKVYFGGFYTEKKNGSNEGVIFSVYDIKSGAYETTKFLTFDDAIKAQAGHSNGAFDNYMVRQLIVRNDGGFVMVSEINYVTTRSNFAPNMGYYSSFYSPYNTTTVREYHFNDIMAISYNKDGSRQWSAVIPKEQYSQEDGGNFSSYLMLNTGGTLAFLFNDFNARHSRIQLATLDADGKKQANSFSVDGNDLPDWVPQAGKQVAARTLIIPCLHKKQICFAKVVF